MLQADFFDRPANSVAKDLVGKVIRRKYQNLWLAAAIVETEAYGADKASHSFLGRTPSRESMWARAGTIYMYMSQGGDSFNISVQGDGHAVLIKSGRPWMDAVSDEQALMLMHTLNPGTKGQRSNHKLLAGQSLLARALHLKVKDWDGKAFEPENLYIEDVGYKPKSILRCRRIGIPAHRDPDLMLRYVDEAHANSATQNPLSKRAWQEGLDYQRLAWQDKP